MSSDLDRERAWMRKCAADATRSPEDRALFARLADDIDAYLAGEFSEAAQPTDEDVALWEDA